jgi:hypothetical protein
VPGGALDPQPSDLDRLRAPGPRKGRRVINQHRTPIGAAPRGPPGDYPPILPPSAAPRSTQLQKPSQDEAMAAGAAAAPPPVDWQVRISSLQRSSAAPARGLRGLAPTQRESILVCAVQLARLQGRCPGRAAGPTGDDAVHPLLARAQGGTLLWVGGTDFANVRHSPLAERGSP